MLLITEPSPWPLCFNSVYALRDRKVKFLGPKVLAWLSRPLKSSRRPLKTDSVQYGKYHRLSLQHVPRVSKEHRLCGPMQSIQTCLGLQARCSLDTGFLNLNLHGAPPIIPTEHQYLKDPRCCPANCVHSMSLTYTHPPMFTHRGKMIPPKDIFQVISLEVRKG